VSPLSPARIRRATAGDRAAVLAFCQDTFSWGDYIDQEWDDWLGDPTGMATETTNDAALRQVARLGFAPLAEFGHWLADADAGITTSDVRQGRADELDKIAATWRASDVTVAGGGLVAVGWGWRALIVDDLAAGLASNRVLMGDGGFGLLGAVADETRLVWLDGAPAVWEHLLLTARRLAADEGHRQASALLPRHAGIEAALAGAGFEREGAYRILAKAL
jgi:hypothetical protein